MASLLSELNAQDTYVFWPPGGRCPRPGCSNSNTSVSKDVIGPKKILGSPSGWPARFYTIRKRCRACQHAFSCLDEAFLDSLPENTVADLLRTFVIGGQQTIIFADVIHRLRNNCRLKREIECQDGIAAQALARRRAIFSEAKAELHQGTLLHHTASKASSELALQEPHIAVPQQARLHYATLRNSYLSDFQRHRRDLEREIASVKAVRSLSIDHTRAGASISMNNQLGYLVGLISDEGYIMGVLAVGSCALADIAQGLKELRGRVPVDETTSDSGGCQPSKKIVKDGPSFTIFLDRGCCGREGEATRRLFIKNTGCTAAVRLRLDSFHCQLRLSRSVSSANHALFGMFCKKISRAFFCSSRSDMEKAKAENIQKGGNGVLSREQLRRRVRRFIPPPLALEKRLARVIEFFFRLDNDAQTHHGPSEGGDLVQQKLAEPLLGSQFWPSYRNVLCHVRNGCVSDSAAGDVCTMDSSEGYRWGRGSSRSENRHSVWRRDLAGVSRLSPMMMDALLLWRAVFSNRRLQKKLDKDADTLPIPLAPREAGSQLKHCVKLADTPVTFGSAYLAATNQKFYQSIFREWLSEGCTKEGSAGQGSESCDDVAPETDESDCDMSSAASDSTESVSDTAERLQNLISSGTTKGKVLKMVGPRAGPHPIPLAHWTPLVKGVVAELVAEVGHQKPDEVYKRYQKKVFSELHDVIEDTSGGRKPPLPLHDITPQDVRVFIRDLRRLRSGVPITVKSMQQERLLELDLQAEDEKQGILRSEISRAVVETIGEHPPDRPSAITGDDIVRDWVGQKAAREKVEKAARGTGIPELSSNSAANLPGKECAEEKEDKKARCDTPGLVKGGVMSMVCKYCQQPKAKGYNQHDYSDGSRYGICPMQPPKSTPDPAVVAYAREVAKSVTAYLPDGKKGTQHCGLCGLPLSATLRDTAGKQLASHERFLDEGEKLAWLCPLAGNIPPERVEQLRALKTQRSEAKAARRNEARRIRYIEAKRIRSEDVNEDLQ
ncbi:hypothetical protein FOZ62_026729, partial [Perkinsus olseni]